MADQTNRTTLERMRAMQPGEIAALPPEELAMLVDDLKAAAQMQRADADLLLAALTRRYGERAAKARLDGGRDAGTVRLEDGAFVVVCGAPKNVAWDQKKLRAVWDRIAAAEDDPAQYIDVEYSVPEARYAALPEAMRAPFTECRSVKPGRPTFKFEPAKEAK